MAKTPPAMDCVGNELVANDLVSVVFNRQAIFKVVAVEQGGLHTANGVTPAVVRIVCDMTLRQMPGAPFSTIAKVPSPDAQKLVEAMSDFLPKS